MNCLPSLPQAEACVASTPIQQGWVDSVPSLRCHFICTLSVHVCVFVTIWFKLSSVILFYSTYYFNTGLENTFWFSFIFLTCWMSVNLFIHQLSLRSAKEAGLWLSLTLVASRNMHTLLLCTPSLLLVILPHLFIFFDVLVTLWCWLLLLSGHPMGTKHQFNCG